MFFLMLIILKSIFYEKIKGYVLYVINKALN